MCYESAVKWFTISMFVHAHIINTQTHRHHRRHGHTHHTSTKSHITIPSQVTPSSASSYPSEKQSHLYPPSNSTHNAEQL